MTICTREAEWAANEHRYSDVLGPRTRVVHRSGAELEPLYADAHIGSLLMEPIEYREFAAPLKLYEYLGHGKPIVATAGTLAGDFVEENGIGWAIPYTAGALTALLDELSASPDALRAATARARRCDTSTPGRRAHAPSLPTSPASRPPSRERRGPRSPPARPRRHPWFPTPGAEGVGIFNLRDVELLRREQDVTVLHLCPPAQAGTPVDEADSMRIVRVPFSFAQPATFPGAVRALKALLHTHDVLHTMALPALIPARFVHVRQPWIHTEHYSALVTPPASVRSAVSLRLLKTLFARPTETVAVSAALGRVIDQHRRRPSTVIGNEVMTPVDAVTDRAIPARMRLIAVGGLVARKGPDIAIRALALLRARGSMPSWCGWEAALSRQTCARSPRRRGSGARSPRRSAFSRRAVLGAARRRHLRPAGRDRDVRRGHRRGPGPWLAGRGHRNRRTRGVPPARSLSPGKAPQSPRRRRRDRRPPR